MANLTSQMLYSELCAKIRFRYPDNDVEQAVEKYLTQLVTEQPESTDNTTNCKLILDEIERMSENNVIDKYTYDTDEMVKNELEKFVNEQQLADEKIIITAEQAAEISEQTLSQKHRLELSGLSYLKRTILESIRCTANEGAVKTRVHIQEKFYTDLGPIRQWLVSLGYIVDISRTDYGYYVTIDWS